MPAEASTTVDKYANYQVQLIGWGSKARSEQTSTTLRRVCIKVYNQRLAMSARKQVSFPGKTNPSIIEEFLICKNFLIGYFNKSLCKISKFQLCIKPNQNGHISVPRKVTFIETRFVHIPRNCHIGTFIKNITAAV